ncbi:hypothetical protein MN608_05641 [Microdochium nivale]|nr:hypothetical protein MN608_05641 [Microdochium nivale]
MSAECATHLILLQAFLQLRVGVLCSTALDAALGIEPHEYIAFVNPKNPIGEVPRVRDPTFPLRTLREEKWTVFLTLVVSHFMAWAHALDAEARAGKPSEDRAELLPLG